MFARKLSTRAKAGVADIVATIKHFNKLLDGHLETLEDVAGQVAAILFCRGGAGGAAGEGVGRGAAHPGDRGRVRLSAQAPGARGPGGGGGGGPAGVQLAQAQGARERPRGSAGAGAGPLPPPPAGAGVGVCAGAAGLLSPVPAAGPHHGGHPAAHRGGAPAGVPAALRREGGARAQVRRGGGALQGTHSPSSLGSSHDSARVACNVSRAESGRAVGESEELDKAVRKGEGSLPWGATHVGYVAAGVVVASLVVPTTRHPELEEMQAELDNTALLYNLYQEVQGAMTAWNATLWHEMNLPAVADAVL
eukprot:9034251-Pyramimonas_sp.AAC.1